MEGNTKSEKHKSTRSIFKKHSEETAENVTYDTAKRSPETDKLFAEYLRVINEKDETIHQLLVEIEKLNLELKIGGDTDKETMRGVVKTLERLKETTLEFAPKEAELSRLRRKTAKLMKEVENLKESLILSEDKIKSVTRAHNNVIKDKEVESEKQQNREQELERRLNQTLKNVALLESQLEVSKQDVEKDTLSWNLELQRLREKYLEVERANSVLKKQVSEMRSNESVEKEVLELENLHRSVIHSFEREVQHSQEKMRLAEAKANKLEMQVVELSNKQDDQSRNLIRLQQSYQDNEQRLTQLRLEKSQFIQETRDEYNDKIRGLQRTIDDYYSERAKLDGELAIAKQRISDMESSASHANKRFLEDENQLKDELSSLKLNLNDALIELDALKRQTEHQQAMLEAENISNTELRSQLKMSLAENKRGEDLSRQLQESYTKEQDLKIRIRSLENTLRESENTVKEVQDINAQLLRDTKRMISEKEQLISDFDMKYRYISEELESSRRQCSDLMGQVDTNNIREKTATVTIHELERSIDKFKESVREKEGTIETLQKDILNVSVTNSGLLEEQNMTRASIERERKEKEKVLQAKVLLENIIHQKEYEIAELNSTIRRVEKSANEHEEELSRQLELTRDRVQSLVSELHSSQQELNISRIERSKVETRASEQLATLEKNVVEPLKQQNDELIQTKNTYLNDISSLNEKVMSQKRDLRNAQQDVGQLRTEIASRDRKIVSIEEERDALRSIEVECRKVKKELMIEKENTKRVELLEQQLALLTKDLQHSREKELAMAAEASNKRSEALTWKERCTNLESLKNISDTSLVEYQKREREMLLKIEEMHRAHQDMQICYEKQNEQVELGRRLREQDAQRGPRH